MSYTIHRFKTDDDWLEFRKKVLGASDMPTVCRVNPHKTEFQLWLQKTGRAAPEATNAAMIRGHEMEPVVVDYFIRETGAKVFRHSEGNWIAQCNEMPWLGVSPDRLYTLPGEPHSMNNARILECKSTYGDYSPENYPREWYIQTMYQMGVMGIHHGTIGCLRMFPELSLFTVPVEFDRELYMEIVAKGTEFWKNHVEADVEPEMLSGEDVLRKYPKEREDAKYQADERALALLKEYVRYSREEEAAKAVKESCADQLKILMGDAGSMVRLNDKKKEENLISFKKSKDSLKVDTEILQKEFPEVFKECSFETEGKRTFRVSPNVKKLIDNKII